MNKKKELWKALLLSAIIFAPLQANAQDIEATLLLKQPGNRAVAHQLHLNNEDMRLKAHTFRCRYRKPLPPTATTRS